MAHRCQFFDCTPIEKLQTKLHQKIEKNTEQMMCYQNLLAVLNERRSAFKKAASAAIVNDNEALARKFLHAGIHFEKTVANCLHNPHMLKQYIEDYFDAKDYIHVGNWGTNTSYTDWDGYNALLADLGILIAIGMIFALSFALTTPAPLILGVCALTILIPSAFYHFAVTKDNQNEVHDQEMVAFGAFKEAFPTAQLSGSSDSDVVFSDDYSL